MTRTINPTKFELDRHPEAGIGVLRTSRGILPLRSLDVRAEIFGLGSKSVVRQTFYNCYDEPIEATYIFPMPGRDAVTRFVMHVNGREIEGELQERGEARRAYDQAIEKGHAAAIAEEDRSETFTMRVGNIPPGEEVSIEMTLVGQLPIAGDEATFRFPLVVAQKYISGSPLSGKSVGDGTAVDTNSVPDASRVTPPVLIPGMPNPVQLSIEVDIHTPNNFDRKALAEQLSSSLHSVIVNDAGVADGLPLKVRVQPGERLNRDFILRFPFLADQNSCSLLAAPHESGSNVFSVNIVPPQLDSQLRPARDVVFILDRSGSMQGWKMVAARRAVARMVDSMRDVDRFALMAFDTSIEYPNNDKKFYRGTDRNRWNAVQWVGGIDSRGGTELERAIIAGIKLHKSRGESDHQPSIVLITDGQVGAEDAVLKAIKKAGKKCQPTFFCLGIDKAVNHGLLTRIAKLTNGTCETVESEVQLDKVMNRFHREIGSPVLTDVKIESEGFKINELTPAKQINVFPERPISIFGIAKNKNESFELTVSAKLPDGRTWRTTVTAKSADSETMKALWGRERLRDLEDEYVTSASGKLKKKIVKVSLEANVLCRFTSYVAVDRSRVVNEEGDPHKIVQPVEQVEGLGQIALESQLLGSIFGRASGRRVKAKRSIKMAQVRGRARLECLSEDLLDDSMAEAQPSIMDCDDFALTRLEESSPAEGVFGLFKSGPSNPSSPGEYSINADSVSVDDTGLDDRALYDAEIIEYDGDSNDLLQESSLTDAPVSMMEHFVDRLEASASGQNASAIIIQPSKDKATIDYIVEGEFWHAPGVPSQQFELLVNQIMSVAGLNVALKDVPQIGVWQSNSGTSWSVMVFRTKEGPVALLVDSARNASLSIFKIEDPVSVKEMLVEYPWLRSILDSICKIKKLSLQTGNRNPIAHAEVWFTLLIEVADKLSDSQANVVLRMEAAFREAFSNWGSKAMNTKDVLNEMIEDCNQEIEDENREAFWS